LQTKKIYKAILQKCDAGSIHLTLDHWSSLQQKSVLGVKVQYIDEEWNLRNITIGFKHCEDGNTAENLKSAVDALLSEYGFKIEQVRSVQRSHHRHTLSPLLMWNKQARLFYGLY